MTEKGGKPPSDSPDAGSDFSEVSFQRLGQRIADLSRELSDITKLAGQAAPRKLELEAATNAFKSLADAYSKKPDSFAEAQLDASNAPKADARRLPVLTRRASQLSAKEPENVAMLLVTHSDDVARQFERVEHLEELNRVL